MPESATQQQQDQVLDLMNRGKSYDEAFKQVFGYLPEPKIEVRKEEPPTKTRKQEAREARQETESRQEMVSDAKAWLDKHGEYYDEKTDSDETILRLAGLIEEPENLDNDLAANIAESEKPGNFWTEENRRNAEIAAQSKPTYDKQPEKSLAQKNAEALAEKNQ